MHRGKTMWRYREEMVIYKPRIEALGGAIPAATLILDFCPAELWQNKYLWFKHKEKKKYHHCVFL